jgi:hypothetical protein
MEVGMKERPILFNTEMVKAVLDGRKTQTRRVIKPQPKHYDNNIPGLTSGCMGLIHKGQKYSIGYPADFSYKMLVEQHSPYGQVGDRLWVRETWQRECDGDGSFVNYLYKADEEDLSDWSDYYTGEIGMKWKPSIFMPREASRITLEITDIRVERVQDISSDDADAEAFGGNYPSDDFPDIFYGDRERWSHLSIPECFGILWDSINEKRGFGWDLNPWVWVVEFKKGEVQP